MTKKIAFFVPSLHLQTHGWGRLVWGQAPDTFGILTKMVHVMLERGLDNIGPIVFGAGSSDRDGLSEAEVVKQTLLKSAEGLDTFPLIADHLEYVPSKLVHIFRSILIDTASKDMLEEIEKASFIFRSQAMTEVVFISSAGRMPRCTQTVSMAREKKLIPATQMWYGAADDMSFIDPASGHDSLKRLGIDAATILEPPCRSNDPMITVDPGLWPSNLSARLQALPEDKRFHACVEIDRSMRFIGVSKNKVA